VRHPGQRAHLAEHVVVEFRPPVGDRVLRGQHLGPQRQNPFGTETRIAALNVPQRAQEKPRGDEQHHRRDDLGDDERAAQPLFPAADGAAPFAQALNADVRFGPQHRCEPERDGGDQRERCGKHEDPQIDGRRGGRRQR
jgi:hypothetical protein